MTQEHLQRRLTGARARGLDLKEMQRKLRTGDDWVGLSHVSILENTKPELLDWSSQRDCFKSVENLLDKVEISA